MKRQGGDGVPEPRSKARITLTSTPSLQNGEKTVRDPSRRPFVTAA